MSSRNWCGRSGASRCMHNDTELSSCIGKRLPSFRLVSGQWYGLQSHESPHLINRAPLQWTLKRYFGVIPLQAGCSKPGLHRSLECCLRLQLNWMLFAIGSLQLHSLIHSPTQSLTHSLTHSLTTWIRVVLEKLTGSQLVKKFPIFYGTRRFITAITSARQLSLSWARSIQSISSHPTSCSSILTLRRLMSYIYGASILDVSRSHTTTQHSR